MLVSSAGHVCQAGAVLVDGHMLNEIQSLFQRSSSECQPLALARFPPKVYLLCFWQKEDSRSGENSQYDLKDYPEQIQTCRCCYFLLSSCHLAIGASFDFVYFVVVVEVLGCWE